MELNQILTVGIIIAVAGIGLVFTMDILSDVKDDYTTSQTANDNLTRDVAVSAQDSLTNIGSKMPLIATVVVAAILIGLLLRFGNFGGSN
jgi:hypothetical protein